MRPRRRLASSGQSGYDAPLALPRMSETMMTSEQDQWKKAAAEAAAKIVEDGMVVGLGSGSTAAFFVSALARRISDERLRIVGIATSEQTAQQARNLRIPLATFAEQSQIDLTVDGADEVQPGTLFLIKGHGGAPLARKDRGVDEQTDGGGRRRNQDCRTAWFARVCPR